MRKPRSGGNAQVFRITGARQGLAEDVRGRQRRYVISMSIRTVSVILAATLWNVERPVAVIALVLGATLPYVAVVIANAGRENTPSLPSTFVTVPLRPMLTQPSAEAAPRPDGAQSAGGSTEPDPERDPADAPAGRAAGVPGQPRERS